MKKIIGLFLIILLFSPFIGFSEQIILSTDWEVRFFVDSFNDPTTERYVTNKNLFIGTFSNSATTNSRLDVQIIWSKNEFSFKLIEYGIYVVKPKSYEKYKMLVKNPDGEIFSFELESKYTDRVSIPNTDESRLFGEQLGLYDYLKISIVETEHNSRYNFQFSVNQKRLTECLKEIELL